MPMKYKSRRAGIACLDGLSMSTALEDMSPVRCLLTLVYIGTSLRECCRERIVDVAARRGNVWNA